MSVLRLDSLVQPVEILIQPPPVYHCDSRISGIRKQKEQGVEILGNTDRGVSPRVARIALAVLLQGHKEEKQKTS